MTCEGRPWSKPVPGGGEEEVAKLTTTRDDAIIALNGTLNKEAQSQWFL